MFHSGVLLIISPMCMVLCVWFRCCSMLDSFLEGCLFSKIYNRICLPDLVTLS